MKLSSFLVATSLLFAASVLVIVGCSSSTGPDDRLPYPEIDGLVVFYAFDGNYENEVAVFDRALTASEIHELYLFY